MKNTCEGVHLLKLPTISLQACKFTKNELLHTYVSRILTFSSYYLLYSRIPRTFIFQSTFQLLLLLVIAITKKIVYSISYKNAFHSYSSFLLILTLIMGNSIWQGDSHDTNPFRFSLNFYQWYLLLRVEKLQHFML